MENQTDFAQQDQQQGQIGREQQAFQQQAQQGQQGQQQGRGRGALVALAIIGLLVGIGGAGFGVYTMTQKNDKPADLKVKIEKSDGSVVELETDKIKKADDGSTITISDSATGTEKYIMLGNYGIGLKIPSDSKLEYIQYEYRQFSGGPSHSYLGIGGVTKKEGAQALPEFVAQGDGEGVAPLAYIDICRNDVDYAVDGVEWVCTGNPVYSNDTISIYYVSPQAVMSQDPEEAKWEIETVNAIREWVSNKDNYVNL